MVPTLSAYESAQSALFAQWQLLVDIVERLEPEEWQRPTRLDAWNVAGLVSHIAGTVGWLSTYASKVVATPAEVDSLSYFASYDDTGVGTATQRRADETTPAHIVDWLRANIAKAHALIAERDPDEVIAGGGASIRFEDMVTTRLVEAVVHGLDLAAATSTSFEQDPAALKQVAKWCGKLLERSHKGKTIEVRVPPATAVQIAGPEGDGPKHKRGTPPNTVEMNPTTWIELASGRLSWADAVSSYRVSASGRLADLDFVLPLMR